MLSSFSVILSPEAPNEKNLFCENWLDDTQAFKEAS